MMMSKMFTKILAVCLSVTLVLCISSITVFAQEAEGQDATIALTELEATDTGTIASEGTDTQEDNSPDSESTDEMGSKSVSTVLVSSAAGLLDALVINAEKNADAIVIQIVGSFDIGTSYTISKTYYKSVTITRADTDPYVITGSGRSFTVNSDCSLTLENIESENIKFQNYGALVIRDSILTDATVDNRDVNSVLTMTNSKFYGEISNNYSAIMNSGTAIMNNCTMLNAGSISSSGKVDGSNGSVMPAHFTMTDSSISGYTMTAVNNSAHSTFVMTNSTIRGEGNGRTGVDNGGTFTMDSGEISGNTEEGVSNYSSSSSGNTAVFDMNGGKIFNNGNLKASHYGGGVCSSGNVIFNMKGGEIFNNSAGVGGGVQNTATSGQENPAVFNMSGGKIYDNNAMLAGGGVSNMGAALFKMTGGEISGNIASELPSSGEGGGVYNNNGTFIMEGGMITGNHALSSGGGVYNPSDFTMTGGTISDNTARHANDVYNSGTFNLSGDPKVHGLYISSAKVPFVTDRFIAGAQIILAGVPYYTDSPAVVAKGLNYTLDTDDFAKFSINGDNYNYTLSLDTTGNQIIATRDGSVTPTGVTISPSPATVAVDKTVSLTATVTPAEASQSVTWSSSHTDIATVSANGVVTGIAVGEATITATTADGSKTATCNVTVENDVIPVESISLNKDNTSIEIGGTETLIATITPSNASDKTVKWQSSDAAVASVDNTGVVTAVSEGTANITVTTNDGGRTATCAVTVIDIQPTGITISPSHAVLMSSQPEIVFSAVTNPVGATAENVAWSISPSNALTFKNSVKTGGGVTLVMGSYTGEAIVTASLGGFTSTATVMVLGNVQKSDLQVELLTTKVTLNKLKDGVLVPIDIMEGASSANSVSAFGGVSAFNAGLIEKIEVSGGPFTATPVSDRFFLLSTSDATKNGSYKELSFDFYFSDAEKITSATKLEAAVVEKYPRITVTADPLDLFYPERPAKLTVTSDDGNVTISGASIDGVKLENGQLWINGVTKAGTAKGTLTLNVEGYKAGKSYRTAPKISVKVTETKPKLKLAVSSITLNGSAPATLQLVSGDTSRSLESFNISGVTGDGVVANSYNNGYFQVAGLSDKTTLRVAFADTTKIFQLTLNVKTGKVAKPSINAKVKTVTVNTKHTGVIATIDVTGKPNNLDFSTMKAEEDIEGISAVRSGNQVILSADGMQKNGAGGRVNITIDGVSKPLAINVKVTDKDAKARVSLKGKLDVTAPDSKINATVKLTNTTAELNEVTMSGDDFTAQLTGPNTFEITAANPNLEPGVRKDVTATIKLKNGDSLTSALKITPIQGKTKAWQSKKEINLIKSAPRNGDELALGLINTNMSLGEIQINKRSVARNDDFVLVRSGANNVTLHLDPEKNLLVQSGKSYTVKLELWPAGTYEVDGNGDAFRTVDGLKALGKAKPTIVSVKVNVK